MKKFYEKDLEEIIYNASISDLFEKGLQGLNGKKFRQFNLGKYGIIDILAVRRWNRSFDRDPFLTFSIFELKEDKIGVSAFFQAVRYARGIQVYMKTRKPNIKFSIHISLIGSELDTAGSLCFLPNLINPDYFREQKGVLESVHFYTYSYEFNGIQFKDNQDYVIV